MFFAKKLANNLEGVEISSTFAAGFRFLTQKSERNAGLSVVVSPMGMPCPYAENNDRMNDFTGSHLRPLYSRKRYLQQGEKGCRFSRNTLRVVSNGWDAFPKGLGMRSSNV